MPAGALCAPTLSASTDLVSRLVPAPARGEAMGWHGSSLTVGLAIGSPLAGWAIDHGSPGWGFATVGTVGLLITAVLLVLRRGSTPLDLSQPPATTAVSPTAAPTAAPATTPPTTAALPADSLPAAALPTNALPTNALPDADLLADAGSTKTLPAVARPPADLLD